MHATYEDREAVQKLEVKVRSERTTCGETVSTMHTTLYVFIYLYNKELQCGLASRDMAQFENTVHMILLELTRTQPNP